MVSGPGTPVCTPEPSCLCRSPTLPTTPGSCPSKAKPTCYGRLLLGGREGGGSQLYFGEAITLWGLSSPALPAVRGARAEPARPAGRTWSGGAQRTRTGERAACSRRGIDIGVTQRVSFPHGLSGVGAGWLPFQPPINFQAPALEVGGLPRPDPTSSPNTPLSGAGEGAGEVAQPRRLGGRQRRRIAAQTSV